MNSPTSYKLLISPIGQYGTELIGRVITDTERVFGFPTEVVSLLDNVDFALDTKRNQYHSTMILTKLAELAPADMLKILAITHNDLFIPILTHVYGEAQLGGKSSVISVHRLKEGFSDQDETYLERISKEAVHELGHTFNLRHCKDPACIMHYCRDIKDVDKKTNQLCRYCKILLRDDIQQLSRTSG
ncbi:MAG: archaemetzincin family Zn-dependent metalloprotease [Desulfobacteraceae bacterium]|nr:archaemetzincin family Zn-dependent metalloprotease [Desulfobacteraceae bacterium]